VITTWKNNSKITFSIQYGIFRTKSSVTYPYNTLIVSVNMQRL